MAVCQNRRVVNAVNPWPFAALLVDRTALGVLRLNSPVLSRLRFLLLQVRNPDDPMRSQEVTCFCQALGCEPTRMETFDLTSGEQLSRPLLDEFDVVLIGGSGDYSVAEGGPWWPAAETSMQLLYDTAKPTFASCWGFQALARALGGYVVTDLSRAEVGTITVTLNEPAFDDPVFAAAPREMLVQSGHQDIVDRIPEDAVCLVSSDRVANEAMTFPGRPIYATQFHPELTRAHLVQRIITYPQYIEKTVEVGLDEFIAGFRETPECNLLLRRFVDVVFG